MEQQRRQSFGAHRGLAFDRVGASHEVDGQATEGFGEIFFGREREPRKDVT
jgi:hypothetical protein